ncbi:MAG: hypothetical protein SFT68_00005, partial [Rickettsiaceae bacterium]|nr:hypothetical protein [Rickettsiaceae bacterium]
MKLKIQENQGHIIHEELCYLGLDNKAKYLTQVALKILELKKLNPEKDFWVITPNYFSIEILKQELFFANNSEEKTSQSLRAIILPRITTAENYIQNQILHNSYESYSNYEEIVIMSQIIMKYPNRLFRAGESIAIAAEFVLLFWNLKKNFIDINSVDEWVEQDLSAYWHYTADFLKYVFCEFEEIVCASSLSNNNEIFKGPNNRYLILVGLTENLQFFTNYFKESKVSHLIILPPLINIGDETNKEMIKYLTQFYDENII